MILLDFVFCAELKIVPKQATTTTPTPYIYSTMKPRRKQHQNHNHKGGHGISSRVKETLLPNLQENEIVAGAGNPFEGMCTSVVHSTCLLPFQPLFLINLIRALVVVGPFNAAATVRQC